MRVHHLAFLFADLEELDAQMPALEFGPAQTFPKEGTVERYLDVAGVSAKILAIAPMPNVTGPYQRALAKHGRGLHHIGGSVRDVYAFLDRVAKDRWRLHATSLRTYRDEKTVWITHEQFPILFEVAESPGVDELRQENVLQLSLPVAEEVLKQRLSWLENLNVISARAVQVLLPSGRVFP